MLLKFRNAKLKVLPVLHGTGGTRPCRDQGQGDGSCGLSKRQVIEGRGQGTDRGLGPYGLSLQF
jgi:hypothetical protein